MKWKSPIVAIASPIFFTLFIHYTHAENAIEIVTSTSGTNEIDSQTLPNDTDILTANEDYVLGEIVEEELNAKTCGCTGTSIKCTRQTYKCLPPPKVEPPPEVLRDECGCKTIKGPDGKEACEFYRTVEKTSCDSLYFVAMDCANAMVEDETIRLPHMVITSSRPNFCTDVQKLANNNIGNVCYYASNACRMHEKIIDNYYKNGEIVPVKSMVCKNGALGNNAAYGVKVVGSCKPNDLGECAGSCTHVVTEAKPDIMTGSYTCEVAINPSKDAQTVADDNEIKLKNAKCMYTN